MGGTGRDGRGPGGMGNKEPRYAEAWRNVEYKDDKEGEGKFQILKSTQEDTR